MCDNNFEQVLYLIMRTDLPDNNPGKMMAQAGHVVSDFECWANEVDYAAVSDEIKLWRNGRNFGTKIVLESNKKEINEMNFVIGYSRLVYDPTYPYRNYYGDIIFSNELVGMWVFINKYSSKEEIDFIKQLPLHR